MKILCVTDKIAEGGAERACVQFAGGLANIGNDVTILVNRILENEYEVSDSVKVVRLPQDKLFLSDSLAVRNIKRLPTIRKIIKKLNPDYIIPFMESNTIITLLATLGLHDKVIATVRVDPNEPSPYCPNWVRDIFLRSAYKIFCQNNQQVEYFSPKVRKRCFAIPNCCRDDLVPEGEKRERRDKIVRIIAMGRLCGQKNFELLIEAFSAATEKNEDITLDIFGEGPSRDDLEQLADKLGMSERIRFRGWTCDVAETMREADLFILSSDYEGMPNSLQEAMTCGVPCIATDCPTGPADMIKNGETGVLIAKGDKNAMRDAIEWMVSNPQLANVIGKNGYEFAVKNYRSDEICKALIKKIEE